MMNIAQSGRRPGEVVSGKSISRSSPVISHLGRDQGESETTSLLYRPAKNTLVFGFFAPASTSTTSISLALKPGGRVFCLLKSAIHPW